mgnify:CR=1 FL=1
MDRWDGHTSETMRNIIKKNLALLPEQLYFLNIRPKNVYSLHKGL